MVSVNMAHNDDNNIDLHRRMQAQEEAIKNQQTALNDIQRLLGQILVRQSDNSCQNNNRIDDDHNHHSDEEENRNHEQQPLPPLYGLSSVDVDVIKIILAQLASLTQRDELKKIGAIRPYPLEWDSVPYPLKFKPLTLHSYDNKTSPNQHIYYFRSQTGNVIGNDAIVARLFIGTLKG